MHLGTALSYRLLSPLPSSLVGRSPEYTCYKVNELQRASRGIGVRGTRDESLCRKPACPTRKRRQRLGVEHSAEVEDGCYRLTTILSKSEWQVIV